MKDCCIEGCKTSVMRDVMTFEFPTSRVLRKKWLDAISPEVKLAPDARVCLRHFTTEDYEAVRGKLRLRGKVVPTLFGEKAQSPQPQKDPLDEPNIEEKEPQEIKDPITDNHNGNVDNDNGKCDNENVDNKKCGKENSSNKDTNGHNDNGNNDKVNNDKDNENDNRNDNEIQNDVKKIDSKVNKRTASKVNKKVKKKWVPMRHRPDDQDSLSEDSVNSDEPPPPILEDLEEHLPNYQIANMKTERQIAAMTEELEPLPEPTEVEECVEPHVPVFIELSVGQDNNQLGSEQPNDCLMVLESVQCDIDPTLMLEARAEDEDCCEQIDLDDDDDDDDDDDVPAKILKKAPADPISLLTSSDEDDVIIQEPHIDTLSVSDATDEDDVPLQKLIKKEKKTKKLKKKKKREAIQSILVGVSDFYCYHCQHVSTSRSAHDRHVKGHLKEIENEQSQGKTRVYQICKECGFTTSSKSQLLRHQRKHLNEKRYKCPLCTYRSKYNMSLMYHLKTHNYDPNMYNCGACGLKLDSKKALLKHQDACYELGAISCDKCSYKADTSQAMKLHKNTIHK